MKVHPPNGLLSEWIRRQFAPGHRGWCIDVGASDGVSVNTTYLLEKQFDWYVLSVEPNPAYWPLLKRTRTWVSCVACDSEPGRKPFYVNPHNPEAFSSLRPAHADASERIEVQVRTVDQLLAQWEFPQLDCLCVDTEGTELDVLKGCDLERWKPRALVIESWDPDGGDVRPYVEALGYVRRDRNVHNDLYTREEPSP